MSSDALLAAIAAAPWFAACGTALSAAEREHLCLYAAGLGFVGVQLAPVVHWRDAAQVTRRSDWSRAWWDAEAALERQLRHAALSRTDEPTVLAMLSRVTAAAQALDRPAAAAMAEAGAADEALMRVAAGAAAQACHQAGLTCLAAADPGSAFAEKFALFAAGRWPLGIVGGRLFVF